MIAMPGDIASASAMSFSLWLFKRFDRSLKISCKISGKSNWEIALAADSMLFMICRCNLVWRFGLISHPASVFAGQRKNLRGNLRK